MSMLTFMMVTGLLQAKPDAPHIQAAAYALKQGKAALATKQFALAVSYFEKAIEIEPTFLEARKALIRSEIAADRKLEAAKALTQLLEIEPDDVASHILLGQMLLDQQQAERALAQFSAALSLEPNSADALLGFSAAASKLGMTDRAKDAMERGRRKYPTDSRFQVKPQN